MQVVRDINERQARELAEAAAELKRVRPGPALRAALPPCEHLPPPGSLLRPVQGSRSAPLLFISLVSRLVSWLAG